MSIKRYSEHNEGLGIFVHAKFKGHRQQHILLYFQNCQIGNISLLQSAMSTKRYTEHQAEFSNTARQNVR